MKETDVLRFYTIHPSITGGFMGRTKLRAVTHLDVSRQDIERAIDVFRRVL